MLREYIVLLLQSPAYSRLSGRGLWERHVTYPHRVDNQYPTGNMINKHDTLFPHTVMDGRPVLRSKVSVTHDTELANR